MARTSKTKIGNSGESNDRQMRAAESGAALKQRAHEGLMSEYQNAQQQGAQMGATYGGLAQRGQELNEQSRQFNESHALRKDQLDLEAAGAGFERGGDRASKLDAEMDRGAAQGEGVGALDPESQKRIQEQTGKGIEFDGSRWVPTQERQAEKKAESERKGYQAETDRMRAEAYRAQVTTDYNAAKRTGNTEEAKVARNTLLQPIKSNVGRLDRMQNGKQTDDDWASLAKAASGVPEPQLQADIKSRVWSPRVREFLNTTINYDALKYISGTGDLPDGDMVDLGSPKMQEFAQSAGQVTAYMKAAGPAFSQWAGIDSNSSKTAFVNKMAAAMVLSGMSAPAKYQPQGVFEGMAPSAGQPQEAGAPPAPAAPPEASAARGTTMDHATDSDTQAAIQARKAGRPFPPTDTPGFRNAARGRQPRNDGFDRTAAGI